MSKKALFLADPLTGISYSDALDWRKYVESKVPGDHDHAFVRQVAAFVTGDLDEAIQTAVDVATMSVA